MLRIMVYSSINALLLVGGCAKKTHSITCANPDPATGQCLRDETQVVNPNNMEATLEKNTKIAMNELREENKRLEKELAAAKQAGNTQQVEETEKEIKQNKEKIQKQDEGKAAPSAQPMVDENKVPEVKLTLRNKRDNKGVRVELKFTHNKNISDFVFRYGSYGRSQIFNFDNFTHKRVQLADVEIPVRLSFKFKGADYCARVDVSYRFEETPWPSEKYMHVSEGVCKL